MGNPTSARDSGTSAYATFPKITSIAAPTLGFVFLDEREDSINDGSFFTGVDSPSAITDVPASYHGGAAGFSFADGHSEMHKWLSAKLNQPIQKTPINNWSVAGDNSGMADSYWLCAHALARPSFP